MAEIQQINIQEFDERFYQLGDKFAPSITYLLQCVYPQDGGLMEWVGDVGNKRAEEIKTDAGEDGSFVHESIEKMLKGFRISNDEISERFKAGKRSLKVKRCLKAFLTWYDDYKPTIISTERTIWSEEPLFAGTLDLDCYIKNKEGVDEKWTIDFKSTKSIHDSHRVQVTGYRYANGNDGKCAILHLGNLTKKHYSFLEVDHEKYFKELLVAEQMFRLKKPNASPNQETFPEYFEIKEYPLKLKL